jgi:predicted Ser/Thr protein kinase
VFQTLSDFPASTPATWRLEYGPRLPGPSDGETVVSLMSRRGRLPGITKTWHPLQIDHLSLLDQRKLRSNVYEVTCPSFPSKVIAKFARFEWEVPQLEAETTAYEWIDGQQIGPNFLAHLTEEGRVIGFLMARITNCRHAMPEDFLSCHEVLSKLHELGIKHGDINKHNFLIHDGRTTLIDFDNASRPVEVHELEAELNRLQELLQDVSGKGGQVLETGSK